MTSIILSTICALALNAGQVPPQPQHTVPVTIAVDTLNLYIIDSEPVRNFNGSQLLGKTITSYKISKAQIGDTPVTVHTIGTKDGAGDQTVVIGYGVLKTGDNSGSDDVTVISPGEKIRIRTTSPSVSVDDIVYIVGGKQISSEEFKKLDPKDIKSIEVIKDSSAAKYLQDLKDRGRYQGDVNASGGVIIVTLK